MTFLLARPWSEMLLLAKQFFAYYCCIHYLCQQICLFPSCHLVTVPPGPALADALRSSPVIRGEDGYAPAAGFGSGFDDVDPNLDPELALVSLFCM